MVDAIFVLMALLAMGFLGTKIAKVMNLPHSVFLVVLGVVSGLLIRKHSPEGLGELEHMFPEIILFILLPPLVFESAYNLHFNELKKDMGPIGMLAVFGLLVSTFIVGFALNYVFGLPILPCLTFGALISATDPVAVVALFKEIGAPKRLNTLVEGESLLNDGTAIVLFRVLVAATVTEAAGVNLVSSGAIQFAQVAIGGIIIGIIVAVISSVLLKLTISSTAAQLGITVSAAYLSFIIADHYFHVSGIMGTLTVGLYLGSRARLELNKESLHGMHYIWEFLALAANTVVFFAVGVTVDPQVLVEGVKFIPATLAIVYVARGISVFALVPVCNVLKLSKPIGFGYKTIMMWGGLRGGLALGLVLMLPHDFPHKQLFLALATSVVFATLFLNALTIKQVLHWLKLDLLDPIDQRFFQKTLELVQDSVYTPLLKAGATGSLSKSLVESQKRLSQEILLESSPTDEKDSTVNKDTDTRFAITTLLLTERKYYYEKLEDGVLSKGAYVALLNLVSDRMDIYNTSGIIKLKHYKFDIEAESLFSKIFSKIIPWKHGHIKTLTMVLEVMLHLKFAIEEALHEVTHEEARNIGKHWLELAKKQLEDFYKNYPYYGTSVQTFFIANTVCASSEKTINHLLEASIISGSVYSKAKENVEDAHYEAIESGKKFLNPSTSYLLSRVPLFKDLPELAIEGLADEAQRQSFKAGHDVVKMGDAGDSFYLISAGMVEVDLSHVGPNIPKPRLFAGDCFGEMSLLFNQPRGATVTSTAPTEVVEIKQNSFNKLMSDYPKIKEQIESIAKSRQVK